MGMGVDQAGQEGVMGQVDGVVGLVESARLGGGQDRQYPALVQYDAVVGEADVRFHRDHPAGVEEGIDFLHDGGR